MTKHYGITAFSKMTSVTIRTLHYYDEIALLQPSYRTASGHRRYSEGDLLRLQQICTLKYMGFPLTAIKEMLQASSFDATCFLHTQAQTLIEEADKLKHAANLLNYIAG